MTELDKLKLRKHEIMAEIDSAKQWGAFVSMKNEELQGVLRQIKRIENA